MSSCCCSRIRIKNGVTGNTSKIKNPIKGAGYDDNAESKDYFGTYITLEKSDIFTEDKIKNVANASWNILARNDDSGEMPKQPSESSYNSLLRYKSKVGDPLKHLLELCIE